MGEIDDRRMVQCDNCGNVYPGYQHAAGDVRAIGAKKCKGCGGESFSEFSLD